MSFTGCLDRALGLAGVSVAKELNLKTEAEAYQIIHINSKTEQKIFIRIPEKIHAGKVGYVRNLRQQEYLDLFAVDKNPSLKTKSMWPVMLQAKGEWVGRVIFYLDEHMAAGFGGRIGFFGHFEALNETVATYLFSWVQEKAKEQDCQSILGPVDLVSQKWGVLLNAHQEPAPLMGMWNPPEYLSYYEQFSFEPKKDLLAWRVESTHKPALVKRFERAKTLIPKRFNVKVRPLHFKSYGSDVEAIVKITNEAFVYNYGFSSISLSEGVALARDLKPIVNPNGVIFCEDAEGNIIGYIMVLPDLNVLLKKMKGSLWPFGFITLLLGIKKIKKYRVFGLGIKSQWHGKGISSLLIAEVYARLDHPEAIADIDWVLEDNDKMIKVIKRLGFDKVFKRYRIFGKFLS